MKNNKLRLQNANQENDLGECTKGQVELSIQDLKEMKNVEMAYLVNKKDIRINNTYVLFNKHENNINETRLDLAYNENPYDESNQNIYNRILTVRNILINAVNHLHDCVVWKEFTYWYNENNKGEYNEIKSFVKYVPVKLYNKETEYGIIFFEIPKNDKFEETNNDINQLNNFGLDCSNSKVLFSVQDICELTNCEIAYLIKNHDNDIDVSRAIFNKADLNSSAEGANIRLAYLNAYQEESYVDLLERYDKVKKIIDELLITCKTYDEWYSFSFKYARNHLHKNECYKLIAKKFKLNNTEDYNVVLFNYE